MSTPSNDRSIFISIPNKCEGGARNILVERLTVRQAQFAIFIRGLEGAPVQGLVVRDSSFLAVSRRSVLEHVEDLLLQNVVIHPSAEK